MQLKKKFFITAYYETWEQFEVEAEGWEEAQDIIGSAECPEPVASGDNGLSDLILEHVDPECVHKNRSKATGECLHCGED
jgi:hypothetical protein